MPYVREFLSQRLIIFLITVWMLSAAAVIKTCGNYSGWVAYGSGIVLVMVVEYTVHRFILHEFPKLMPAMYKGHVAHHLHPHDTSHLFGPVRYDFAGYVIIFFTVLAITGTVFLASSTVLGAVTCQIFYQWKHFISHRPVVPITPWGKWMKKKHLLHHYKDEHAWYGVSNPILDVLLGTNTPGSNNKNTPHHKSSFHRHS